MPIPRVKKSWAEKGGKVVCFRSSDDNCFIARFLDADLSSFHDAVLQEATGAINQILVSVCGQSTRELSLIETPDGLFLVWVEPAVGPDDAVDVVDEALGIRDTDGACQPSVS